MSDFDWLRIILMELTYFKIWLFIVASLRIFALYSGFFWLDLFKNQLYPNVPSEVSPLFGRLFSIWTLCSVSVICTLALDPKNKSIYFLNMFIFSIVFFYYIGECFIYKTASIAGSGVVFFVSGFTFLWMLYRILTGRAFEAKRKD